jgi:hypothetical protein
VCLLQGFAERLFTRLQGSRERWETRLDMMTVVSRCAVYSGAGWVGPFRGSVLAGYCCLKKRPI